MIPRAHRFHGLNSLQFVYRQGKQARADVCTLKYARNERRKTYRVAVVVSKKVSKSAVVRNRIRRRLFEAVRLQAIDIKQPYDLVFTIYDAQLATMPAVQVTKTVQQLLHKAAITGSAVV